MSMHITFVARHGMFTARMSSVMGRNIYFCAERYGSPPECLLLASREHDRFFHMVYPQMNSADIDCVLRVLELIFVRDGSMTLSCWTRSDVCYMIACLVTE